jgi:hypothetical protein
MNFETISLLLSWLQMGVLLAILFRLSHTFELIANTQRELRRAINRLGERRGIDRSLIEASSTPGVSQHGGLEYERIIGLDDLAPISSRPSPQL